MQSAGKLALFTHSTTNADIRIAMNQIIAEENPYKILNISLQASEIDVDKAYKALIIQYHPDKQTDAILKNLANDVAAKLNRTRNEVKKGFAKVSDDKVISIKKRIAVEQFKYRIAVSAIFSFDIKKIKLMHTFHEFNFALITLWARSVLMNHQAETLALIEVGLKDKLDSNEDVIRLAQELHTYIHKPSASYANSVAPLLAEQSPLSGLSLTSATDMSWHLESEQALQIIQASLMNAPDAPIIVHNTTFSNDKSIYIGLYFHEGDYYCFDADNLILEADRIALRPLTWSEVSAYIVSVFFKVEGVIANDNKLSVPISVHVLQHSSAAAVNDVSLITSTQQVALVNALVEKKECTAEQILQNIADFELEGLLTSLYQDKPSYFANEILDRYLQVAIQTDNIQLALEICKLDLLQTPALFERSKRYLRDFLEQGKSINFLPTILKRFEQATIPLSHFVTNDMKQKGSSGIDAESLTASILETFLALGLQLQESQRESIVMHLAKAIYTIYSMGTLFQNLSRTKSIDETKAAEKQARAQVHIDLLQMLAKHRYSLTPANLSDIKQHPYYALIKMNRMTEAKHFLAAGLFDLTMVDNQRKTLVNHFSQEEHWEEVNALLALGATYSTGSDIDERAIPPLVGYLESIPELRHLYAPDKFASLLQVECDKGDILCAVLHWNKKELINPILESGFADKLRLYPLRYLYYAKNVEVVRQLLSELDPIYLDVNQPAVQPSALAQLIKVSTIECENRATDDAPSTLMGVTRDKIDSIIKQQCSGTFEKFDLRESNTIYYSSKDSALTKKLYIELARPLVMRCYEAIMKEIAHSSRAFLPNIALLLNCLNELMEIANESHATRSHFIDACEIGEYLAKHQLSRQQYINNVSLLKQSPAIMGIKITFDANDRVVSYCMINHPTLYVLQEFVDIESFNQTVKLIDFMTPMRTSFIYLYRLKAVLEETLHATFDDPIHPLKDEWGKVLSFRYYEDMRKGLSGLREESGSRFRAR